MTTKDRPIALHEAVLLLALKDRQGTILPGTMYQYALGGAIVAELILNGRLALEGEKKTKFLGVLSSKPTGDPILDDCLGRVANARRRAAVASWISRLAGIPRLKHRIAERLCRARILRADEDQVLMIFNRKIYPELDPAPEKRLVEGIRNAVHSEGTTVDPRTSILVALAHRAGLLKAVLPRAELKARKKRIEEIAKGEAVGRAVQSAIEAVQAAVFVAAIVPVICASN